MRKNRKAQIAETLTWVIATIIIVFIISFSVYAAVLLGSAKIIDNSKIGISGAGSVNWIGEKNELAFEKNNNNQDAINAWLRESDLNANT